MPVHDLLGVRYLLTPPDVDLGAPLVLRFADSTGRVYERPHPLPRLFLPQAARVFRDSWPEQVAATPDFLASSLVESSPGHDADWAADGDDLAAVSVSTPGTTHLAAHAVPRRGTSAGDLGLPGRRLAGPGRRRAAAGGARQRAPPRRLAARRRPPGRSPLPAGAPSSPDCCSPPSPWSSAAAWIGSPPDRAPSRAMKRRWVLAVALLWLVPAAYLAARLLGLRHRRLLHHPSLRLEPGPRPRLRLQPRRAGIRHHRAGPGPAAGGGQLVERTVGAGGGHGRHRRRLVGTRRAPPGGGGGARTRREAVVAGTYLIVCPFLWIHTGSETPRWWRCSPWRRGPASGGPPSPA